MTDEKAISIIEHWLLCSYTDAQRIFNGVYMLNGNYYSAYITENVVEICQNGFPIHRISII